MPSQLYDVCNQFEQVFLVSLVPRSIATFGTNQAGQLSDGGPADFHADSDTTAAVLAQTVAAALERAGGLGLARELYRSLSGQRS